MKTYSIYSMDLPVCTVKTKELSIDDPRYRYSAQDRFSILLLDDEPDVTAILKKGLESHGHFKVDAFTNAEDALESILRNDYDILIVDIRLPKMDGFEFYQRARQVKESKVIFITASDNYNEQYQKRFPEWNGTCFVLKPISLTVLTTFLINELTENSAQREPYN